MQKGLQKYVTKVKIRNTYFGCIESDVLNLCQLPLFWFNLQYWW